MGFLEDRDISDLPSIPEFFKGKTIFITGGSGFMGKVLIEKLLYSCTDLDRIYILLRSKKGVKPEERIAKLYSSLCFDRLRKERPGVFESKVFAVAGDVLEIGLGLSEEDRALITNRVNVFFHVAASVRFDDTLTYAAKMNLRGTREVVELAKDIRDLAVRVHAFFDYIRDNVLVHVSTSYSNTNRNPIEELMYPPHADWKDTIQVVETVDEFTLKVLTPKYLGNIPNTYSFTKQLAEHVVYEQRGKLPAVIIRPSIVISSVEEPLPGWIENFNGPVGLFVACGKGIMRSIYSDPDLIADYTPVDVAIKNLIAAAWIRGTKELEATDDIPIYNCCTAKLNNMTLGELVKVGKDIGEEMPLNGALWKVGGTITTCPFVHYIKVILFHLLPALFVDAALWVLGKKPILVKIQRRIYIATQALAYYVTNSWTFNNDNFVILRSRIKEEDKKDFYYEVENVDKYAYFKTCIAGGRRFLLQEKDEDLPKAKAHHKRLNVLDNLVQCIFYGYLFWYFINLNVVQNFLQFLYDDVTL